jgi:hypothetical protein
MTVLAMPGCCAGADGCFAPQNTQWRAASGRSFVQLVHFFTRFPLSRKSSDYNVTTIPMVSLGDVKRSAATLFAQGQHVAALRLYDAIVTAAPLDFDARIRLADCALGLGDPRAFEVYRATAWYCLKAGHPLPALVCARVIEAHGGDASDLTASLVVSYGNESDLLGKLAARVAAPGEELPVAVPDVRIAPGEPSAVATALARCCRASRRPRSAACSAR